MLRTRLWYEMGQAKFNSCYICLLIAHKRRILNSFQLAVTVFSTAGIMGWQFWELLPVFACGIISVVSLARLVQPHIITSEKQLEQYHTVADFYFDFYLKLEALWFDFESQRLTADELQIKFQLLKQSERSINKILNELHRKDNNRLVVIAEQKSTTFFNQSFNTFHL